MRLPLCCGLLLLATAALAQAPAGTQERDAGPRQRQRAPLANVDAMSDGENRQNNEFRMNML